MQSGSLFPAFRPPPPKKWRDDVVAAQSPLHAPTPAAVAVPPAADDDDFEAPLDAVNRHWPAGHCGTRLPSTPEEMASPLHVKAVAACDVAAVRGGMCEPRAPRFGEAWRLLGGIKGDGPTAHHTSRPPHRPAGQLTDAGIVRPRLGHGTRR